MDRQEAIGILQRLKPFLQRKYAVKRLGLFGSTARSVHTESSDVDVLVEFEQPIGIEFIDLSFLLEKEFDKKVDVVSLNGIKDKYFKEIEKDIIYV